MQEKKLPNKKHTKTFFYQKPFFTKKLFLLENFFFTKKPLYKKITQPLHKENQATSSHKKSRNLSTKTSRELQNSALRTSHGLSNVSNCTFQKY